MTTSIKPTPEEMKELLELAAKAAGYNIGWLVCASGADLTYHAKPPPNNRRKQDYGDVWQPEEDDGDLLRLADACEMEIDFKTGMLRTGISDVWLFTPHNHEEMALAVIKAAAAIQKARE